MRTQALAMMFWLKKALAGMYWPNIYDAIIHFVLPVHDGGGREVRRSF